MNRWLHLRRGRAGRIGLQAIILAALLCSALPARAASHSIIGLKLDGGVPDGVGASVVVRPLSFLRFEGGVTSDLAAPGARAGITLSVPWYLSPALSISGGRQWPGNLNRTIARFTTDPNVLLLNRFSYWYANFHGGLEVGLPNWAMLTVHAGYSYLVSRTSGLPEFVAQHDPNLHVKGETTLRVWAPSATVGVIFYFH